MAGRIRDEDVKLVRDASPIAAIVGEQVTLRNAGGGNLKGLCPFHDEKSPSFQVSPARNLYYCFGCNAGGDVIDFVMRVDHLTFAEAVERLAARTGIALRYEEGGYAPRQQQSERTRLVEAHKAAAEFYAERLHAPDATPGRRFLAERGFDAAAAAVFRVGYAPPTWEELVRHLRGRGFTDAELLRGGLASQGRRGLVDRFRGRLVWPICDITGEVIGFGARRLSDGQDEGPKYLNTPETPIYRKSSVLYGVDLAKKDIARQGRAVIVEGYTDVMACHLSGVTTAIATCGTAFGEEHIRIVRRLLMDTGEFRGEVVFTFDGDAAGQKAALRAFAEDQRFVTRTFVAVEPGGMDPCELRLAGGDAAVRDLIDRRVPLFEFAIRSAIGHYDLNTPDGRVGALHAAAPVVASIRDRALRPEYARTLAGWLGMEVEPVVAAVRRATQAPSGRDGRETASTRTSANRPEAQAAAGATTRRGAARPAPDPRDPHLQVERETLKIALQLPALVASGFDTLEAAEFTAPAYAAVRTAIGTAGGVRGPAADPESEGWVAAVQEHAPDDSVRSLITQLAVEPLLKPPSRPDHLYAAEHLARIRESSVKRRIDEVKSALQRIDPVRQAEEYLRVFLELDELEKHRRRLYDGLADTS